MSMIGPNTYVSEVLDGKTMEQALQEIEKMRKELRCQKRKMENGPDPNQCMTDVSPDMLIDFYRFALEYARSYMESKGWELPPTEEELADIKFNERLDHLQALNLIYGDTERGGEQRIVSFSGNTIHVSAVPYGDTKVSDVSKYPIQDREGFILELKELHMGEWKKTYRNTKDPDGLPWKLQLRFTDDTLAEYSGKGKFPFSFNAFLLLMDVDPIGEGPQELIYV